MVLKMFYSNLLRVVNNETQKTQYYVEKCGVMSRISKADYNDRYDSATGFSCLLTKTKGKFTRYYITAIYEYETE